MKKVGVIRKNYQYKLSTIQNRFAFMTKSAIRNWMILPIIVGLIFTLLINSITLLFGDQEVIIMFLNFYNKSKQSTFPDYTTMLLRFDAILQLVSVLLLFIAVAKFEFLPNRKAKTLKWGILFSIVSMVIYGFAFRMISNHQAAANMFFYTSLLYLLLWYIEQQGINDTPILNQIKLLPLIFTFFYTMGQPGVQKLFYSQEVIPKYIEMFQDSFLAQLPGGIPPFIYLIGIFEVLVPIMLFISLLRLEFSPHKERIFLSLALFISSCTFIMLAFGLSVLLNYPGATNLIFYAIFSFLLFIYTYKNGNSDIGNNRNIGNF